MPLAYGPVTMLWRTFHKPKRVKALLYSFNRYLVALGQFGCIALAVVPVGAEPFGGHQDTQCELRAEMLCRGGLAALVQLGDVSTVNDVFQFMQKRYALLGHRQCGVDEYVSAFGARFART